ncbi:MAG: hypothetical protein DKM50_01920 [Candidatus Margulisiibacteriota bacterium]|nr:MAG: hypothetical protein A2X43_13225 [Candidatus Margulisbacteria bacterium GWD2_39_127]OGI04781.1 MAG: hypothetical protein A2X42_10770 [Candidatus Margulisbacteria bacterium GWF2_38_17]OGI05726.1 MAG: hypothetical protein A2X41_03355 [Candidatus Margulisbacteria bacterium GWE2_39_32]PZM83661.1 MAG: hypothetical protein DKM50_01920 [Candidatus Margulisiibacteriota bacterium]HAR62079.1 hypothetical protein [Candidatus Margulisiibacteriota bacterium]
MNILHILPSLNLYGGTPRIVKDLVTQSKHMHYIYCRSSWEGKDKYEEFRVEFIKSNINLFDGLYGKNIVKHIYEMLKIIDKNSIEIIHCYFDYCIVLGGIIRCLRPQIKLIVTFQGSSSPSGYLTISLLALAYRKVDKFIYISKYVKESKYQVFAGLKNKEEQIIYNGANKYKSHTTKLSNQQIISTISGLNKYKNLPVLIDCMNIIVNEKKRNIILNIIGDGDEKANIENRIKIYNLESHINLLGYRSNVSDYLNESLLCVHPADQEGFGIAVVEAMLMKKPVILSNAGALPELIADNESGILADPYNPYDWAEKIMKLLDDKNLRDRVAIKGYERASKLFSIQRYVNELDKVYSGI